MVTLTSPAYSETSDELLEKINREYLQNRPRLAVEVEAEFLPGKPAKVVLRRGNVAGAAAGEPVQPAQNQPVTEENLRRQLRKLGDSSFEASGMQIKVGENAFYPLKQINELRRQAVEALEQALLKAEECKHPENKQNQRHEICRPTQSMHGVENRPLQSMSHAVSVCNIEQLRALVEFQTKEDKEQKLSLRRVYVDGDLLIDSYQECLTLWKKIKNTSGPELLAVLPYILRESDVPYMEKLWSLAEKGDIDGFLVRSLDELGFLIGKEQKSSGRVNLRTDAGFYIWNCSTAFQLMEFADGFCLPYELKASEQRRLLEEALHNGNHAFSWEKVIYGRIPMMVTANCVQKTTDQCRKDGKEYLWLRDRYQMDFPVLRNCEHCVNIIYNSVPLALFGEQNHVNGVDALRLDFTIETGPELIWVLRTCLEGRNLKQGTYTTGHEKRGVE